jgi:hypothetical protein
VYLHIPQLKEDFKETRHSRVSLSMSYIPEAISFIITSDEKQGAVNKSIGGDYFEIQLDDGIKIPKEAINVNLTCQESTVWWIIPNLIKGVNSTLYVYGDSNDSIPVPQLYEVEIVTGLYDLDGLQQALLSGLEGLGARTKGDNGKYLPLVNLIADDATQRVVIRLNYPNV